jgi:hypothetical protein
MVFKTSVSNRSDDEVPFTALLRDYAEENFSFEPTVSWSCHECAAFQVVAIASSHIG